MHAYAHELTRPARRRLCRFVLSGLAAAWMLGCSAPLLDAQEDHPTQTQNDLCSNDESGLKLPSGFCATIFADHVGHARHMVVAPNGTLYMNTWSGEDFGNDTPAAGGFLLALQDKNASGKAGVIEHFGETVATGGAGGTGIALYKNWLYAEINDRIVRYALSADSPVPQGASETVVSGLPLGGDHPMHPFIIDRQGGMHVDVATATNACQSKNRLPGVPGADPCTELETRGGVWRFDANKTGQTFSSSAREATGIRNAEGFAFDATGIFSSPSTDATSCMPTGPNCTNLKKRPLCLRKSCCC